MYIIGENIHIISDKVKEALAARDVRFFQELAVAQVEAGAEVLDLNLGPRKKDWEEVFPWMVKTVEAAVDVPLSLDSTNLAGIEDPLVIRHQPAHLPALVLQLPAGIEHRPVLGADGNQVTAALAVIACRPQNGQIIGFGGPRGPDDFLGIRPHQGGHLASGLLYLVASAAARLV